MGVRGVRVGVWCLRCTGQALVFGVCGAGLGVQGLGVAVPGCGFGVWGLGLRFSFFLVYG